MNTSIASDRLPEDRAVPQMAYDATQRTMLLRAEHSSPSSDTPPEHRLMIAMVRDAIRCIEKYRHARDFRGKRLFEQDSQWVLSDDTSWVHAFVRICETLDLEPDAVRSALGLLRQPDRVASVRSTSPSTMTVH
jgi:hypothetical protein